tara:strand:- start:164 stop:637 length:474 start_codon:yes stop_codon:yes gene_type:complete
MAVTEDEAPRKLDIYEILELSGKKRNRADKVKVLKDNSCGALKDVLRGIFDGTIKWNLPTGSAPPHTPCQEHNHPSSLRRENSQFQYLVKGGKGDKLPAYKRENIFIGMLETVHPSDSELLVKLINKEKPEGISRVVVEEAFPQLLKDSEEKPLVHY